MEGNNNTVRLDLASKIALMAALLDDGSGDAGKAVEYAITMEALATARVKELKAETKARETNNAR